MELILCDKQQKDILLNLYQLYLHDLSEYSPDLQIGSNGFFDVGNIHLYWEMTSSLFPYLITLHGLPIGFILLAGHPYTSPDTDYNLQEVFIARSHRGKGIGRNVIRNLFKRHPGTYYICQLKENIPAIHFWRDLYKELDIPYTESYEVDDGQEVIVQKCTVPDR
ncbi:GNAT family N-acetyltransferase [Brevibacillus sp. SYP-B805]|uniref:GNAT family N-acetyltransferase n=1 Tax=Brevibacillus sp. SYP-B805 TaxID=1578199 RepID=UPI0013EC7351|nr:GNAT family N-acetyltransferase [Brevibacillus sp. SYP-B805]NGQ94508.1 GNAT family N-acetyltransferase [Brevibacillus sp. SYP-B805]